LTKQQVIQLRDSAQLSANLPLSSAKLDGEVRSGRSIELALVRVGLSSTPVARIALPELSGECEGATHFVQSSTVGAFSMATGSIGQASAVAEMFGASGAAKSSSERKTLTNDGSLEACRKSDPDAAAPPAEGRAPPQIELFPILSGEPVEPSATKDDEAHPAHAAAGANEARPLLAMAAQACEVGDGHSCLVEGEISMRESLGIVDPTRAMATFTRGCTLGDGDACSEPSKIHFQGKLVPRDAARPAARRSEPRRGEAQRRLREGLRLRLARRLREAGARRVGVRPGASPAQPKVSPS
jgi:uncharacterized protein